LRHHGIEITERVPLLVAPNSENLPYLRTKRERMDHHLPHLPSTESSSPSSVLPFSADAREGRPTTPDVV
jgi:hypothetical protein